MLRYLILEDGTIMKGIGFGYLGEAYGEIVFTTSMTGYLESMTDPSYRNQILTFASPTVANYPISKSLFESDHIQVSGIVTRDAHAQLVIDESWLEFNQLLEEQNIPGLDLVDTRLLVRKIRQNGVMRAYISSSPEVPENFPDPMAEDVVAKVSCEKPYHIDSGSEKNLLFIDVGTKKSLLNEISAIANLHVVPYNVDFSALKDVYDGIFISNGPGDPSHNGLKGVTDFLEKKAGDLPIYGVCLGHQLISIAMGAETVKMKFGHRGSNHAVTDGKRIYITTHNHGYAVEEASLKDTGLKPIQWDINDRSVEMVSHEKYEMFSVQFHPEASPGPHDSRWYFDSVRKSLGVK